MPECRRAENRRGRSRIDLAPSPGGNVRNQPWPVSSVKISQPRARLRQVVEPLRNAKDGEYSIFSSALFGASGQPPEKRLDVSRFLTEPPGTGIGATPTSF